MLCVELVRYELENKSSVFDQILLLVTPDGKLRQYNKIGFSKKFVSQCPQGFSYHVALCTTNSSKIPELIFDPSIKRPITLTFEQYMQNFIAIPNSDDQPILYSTIRKPDFITQLPFSPTNNITSAILTFV